MLSISLIVLSHNWWPNLEVVLIYKKWIEQIKWLDKNWLLDQYYWLAFLSVISRNNFFVCQIKEIINEIWYANNAQYFSNIKTNENKFYNDKTNVD